MTGIYVLLVLSLNLVLGYCGLLSLATPAFLGVGAYASALLSMRLGWDSGVTFACAILGGVFTGLVLGAPSLRVSRHSFVIVTLSATLLLQLIANNWEDLTRGVLGLASIPAPHFFGVVLDGKLPWYYFMCALAFAGIGAFAAIVSSRVGRAMVAARDNEPLAAAVGIDVFRLRLFAFAVSGGLAGLAGACYAHYVTFIDPGVFGFSFSESLLIMVILGGSGTLWGPVAGAVVFTILPELLRVAPEIRSLLYGSLLFVIVLYMPRGLAVWFGRPRVNP
jgi:branched-chain amino acid transport system permease protein